MEEYCTHQLTLLCTRRSPARLVGRIPPAESVDWEIFTASAWASLNVGYAYLSSRCSHLLVSGLYTLTARSRTFGRGREDVLAKAKEGDPTASGGLRAYNEGHSLITHSGYYDVILEETAQSYTLLKHEHHMHCAYMPGSIHTSVQCHPLA